MKKKTESEVKPKAKAKGKSKSLAYLQQIEIVYFGPNHPEPIKVDSSESAVKVLRDYYDMRKLDYKEIFYVLLLNRGNYCVGISKIGEGSTCSVTVNLREIFQLALKTNSTGVIISHNHPSGSPKPSEADNFLTRKVKEGLKLLDMTLLDHVILTSSTHYSYADEGML
jgi:DNA repair protein RadC